MRADELSELEPASETNWKPALFPDRLYPFVLIISSYCRDWDDPTKRAKELRQRIPASMSEEEFSGYPKWIVEFYQTTVALKVLGGSSNPVPAVAAPQRHWDASTGSDESERIGFDPVKPSGDCAATRACAGSSA